MRILMIIAAFDRAGTLPTIMEVLEPYYQFCDSGAEVVLASLKGGDPIPTSTSLEVAGLFHRFRNDRRAREAFVDTLSLEQVFAEDFDAAYYVGPDEETPLHTDGPIFRIVEQLVSAG